VNFFFRDGPVGATIDGVADEPRETKMATEGHIGTGAPTYWTSEMMRLERHVGPEAKPILVEAKNTGERNAKLWARTAPQHYIVQAQAQLYATGLDCCVLVAKLGASDIRMHVVERDDDFIAEMVAEAEKFLKEVEQWRS
jgi:hypothetical protein